MAKILVTGGAGYVGSHCVMELIAAGHESVIVDDLSNADPRVIDRMETIGGVRPVLIEADVRDGEKLDAIFAAHNVDAVMHFAAYKAVGESVAKPLDYYANNVGGSVSLLQAMQRADVKTFVFSSSATVYGDPKTVPVDESAPVGATNPYGATKVMVEQILADLYASDADWRIARLRYFNPVGAHESGMIGEDPDGVPNNLMPFIAQVAVGRRPEVSVFGDDYDTPDGTGVRDYVHVMDLAEGHLAALEHLNAHGGFLTVNLGTGQGVSVLEMIAAFSRASGREIPYRIVGRRPGDVATSFASVDKAKELLGWQARRDLDAMCADTWRWQSNNPHGYRGNEG